MQESKAKQAQASEFYLRKVAKSGNARYVAVSRVLPKEWQVVKLSVVKLEGSECILRLIRVI